ncbi:hypothetical protein Mapa_013592 [Marchantia paleacea]|nr:hypothetical protein Mapa_013592 [Marchantia paleacea]
MDLTLISHEFEGWNRNLKGNTKCADGWLPYGRFRRDSVSSEIVAIFRAAGKQMSGRDFGQKLAEASCSATLQSCRPRGEGNLVRRLQGMASTAGGGG